MKRIGIFGSALNPPTRSHQEVLRWALDYCELIYVVPAFRHAYGKSMLDYSIRLRLVQAFLKDLHDPRLQMWDIETELSQETSGPVYTFNVLQGIEERLRKESKSDFSLSFIMGPDNSKNFHSFHRSDEIVARWGLLHAPDAGETRSTKVRECIAKGQSFYEMTTPSVTSLIQSEQLYVC